MIVVGSANSSNSVRLVEVALEYGAKAAYRVDYADEVEQAWFDGVATVGVTSGASVPEVLVQQVLDDLAERRLPRRRRGAHGRGGPHVLAPQGAPTGCRGPPRRPRPRRARHAHERPRRPDLSGRVRSTASTRRRRSSAPGSASPTPPRRCDAGMIAAPGRRSPPPAPRFPRRRAATSAPGRSHRHVRAARVRPRERRDHRDPAARRTTARTPTRCSTLLGVDVRAHRPGGRTAVGDRRGARAGGRLAA